MRVLFIDTSSFFVTFAISEDSKLKYYYHEEIHDDMSSKIMPLIRKGFSSMDFNIEDIDKIIVANGPGSFTGIRIGVTIAKTLAWSLKKDIITVSSLELLATSPFNTENIITMIDARRGYVYVAVYNSNLDIVLKPQYILREELKKYDENATYVSYDKLENCVKPEIDVLKLIDKHKDDVSINCHSVNPNYLKKTEAEINLEMKNND